MEPRITLLTLGVRDLDASRSFYRDGLGWPMSSASGDDVAFFLSQGTAVALFRRELLAEDAGIPPEGSGFSGITISHNVDSPAEVDTVMATAAAAGAHLVKPAQDTFWGGYAGFFADPDGFIWEVAWNPGFPLGPDRTMQLPE